jgi:predicted amidohydrolase
MTLGGENHFVTVPWAILNASLLTAVLLRFSILAYGACVLVANLVGNFPMTLDFSRWYAGRSLLVLAVVAAMALYGFRCALGKQAAFGGLIAED